MRKLLAVLTYCVAMPRKYLMRFRISVDAAIQGLNCVNIALARNVGLCARGFDGGDHRLAEAAAIDDQVAGQSVRLDEVRRGGLVRGLTRREPQPDGQMAPVHHRMGLGRQASTGETDGVIRAPFFLRAACWRARKMELSIKCRDPGDFSASALKMRSRTLAFARLL